ncbi:hypothetical protein M2302_006619 [Micromonospora sp. A200]|uniref:DUF6896 domain-containing protein n=1 Tax=Micromonospora sp. A200 TaxID=2940568 RepID=UPI0024770D8F|nr:hypothetical protein [Micromonospora sp. A200]MDH6466411.1 hypothetical protein [Micromonospora sp. A200]
MDESVEAAIEAVRRYAAALERIRSRLLDAYPAFDCVSDLMTAVRHARTLPREGKSSTGIEYSVHGAGCRMTDEQGQEVDIDLVDDAEAFDTWRIKWFLDEQSDARPSVEELQTACSYLSRLGQLREMQAGRWYALPGPLNSCR